MVGHEGCNLVGHTVHLMKDIMNNHHSGSLDEPLYVMKKHTSLQVIYPILNLAMMVAKSPSMKILSA